jgi:hypothetical protein
MTASLHFDDGESPSRRRRVSGLVRVGLGSRDGRMLELGTGVPEVETRRPGSRDSPSSKWRLAVVEVETRRVENGDPAG